MTDEWDLDVTKVSRALFGRGIRLKILLYLRCQTEPFFYSHIADELEIPPQYVGKEFMTYKALGLITEAPELRDDYVRRTAIWCRKNELCPLWKIIDAASTVLDISDSVETLAVELDTE